MLRGEFAGDGVDDADGAGGESAGGVERHAGVEADAGFAGDERIMLEAGVEFGVWNDEEIVLLDGVCAEGVAAGSF